MAMGIVMLALSVIVHLCLLSNLLTDISLAIALAIRVRSLETRECRRRASKPPTR